jgi:hypothetical protein
MTGGVVGGGGIVEIVTAATAGTAETGATAAQTGTTIGGIGTGTIDAIGADVVFDARGPALSTGSLNSCFGSSSCRVGIVIRPQPQGPTW